MNYLVVYLCDCIQYVSTTVFPPSEVVILVGVTVVGRVEGAGNVALLDDEVGTGVVEGGTVLGDRFPVVLVVGFVVGGTVCTDSWGDTFFVGGLDVVGLTEVACASWLFRHLSSFPGRQLSHFLSALAHEQFLQLPVLLQRQQVISVFVTIVAEE